MMKKTITVFTFTGLLSLALFAGEGCCGSCKGKKDDCKDQKKECTEKKAHGHKAETQHKTSKNANGNGEEVVTTEEEVVIIAVPANTAKTPSPSAVK